MKLNLTIPDALKTGISCFGDICVPDGVENIIAEKLPQADARALIITRKGTDICIGYRDTVHFFRALSLLNEKLPYEETMVIPKIGVMLDLSRNSVLTVGSMKKIMRYMAHMGLNQLLLYMEDTYLLPDEPKFGYMRGGYSGAELKALDDYAFHLGIELIPSVQTLGHMEKVLRHGEYAAIRDTENCLLTGTAETAAFLDKVFDFLSATFRSRQVNVGLDETHDLGLGRSLDLYGYKKQQDLFFEHLHTVSETAVKHGMHILFYSDMLFKLHSPSGGYYDPSLEVTPEMQSQIPDNATVVYWDYYSSSYDVIDSMMKRHAELGNSAYAGPIHSVSSFAVNYEGTFRTAKKAVPCAKRAGIKQVYGCLWHDDGAECSDFLGLYAMQFYAEHAYAPACTISDEKLAGRFYACTGMKAKSFTDVGKLDFVPSSNEENRWYPNTGKNILWQDILCGLYDGSIDGLALDAHYEALEKALAEDIAADEKAAPYLLVPLALSRVLKIKAAVGLAVRKHYLAKDTENLKKDIGSLHSLYDAVVQLRLAHRTLWYNTCSPFGWDRLDLRYGGLLARIDTAKWRIIGYLDGSTDSIPELETPRYPIDRSGDKLGVGIWKQYKNISSLSDGG